MKILPKIYRALFFLACLSFVSWQSYSLIEKFLKRPRTTSIELDDTKNWPIPELVFCIDTDNLDFKLAPLKKCNLSRDDYFGGNWLGNCSDPTSLYEEIHIRPHEFIDELNYRTIEGEEYGYNGYDGYNESLWKPKDFINRADKYATRNDGVDFGYEDAMGYEVDLCYAFIIPERMQKQGIQLIEVRTKRHTFLAIAPPGYLYQNWDVLEFIPITSMLQMKLEYQINNFIKIGDEDCVPDPLFNRDDCVLEQLIQNSKELFGCVPPSSGDYGLPICANSSMNSMYLHESVQDATKNCPKSCTVYKMQPRITSSSFWETHGSLDLAFQKTTTISTDQYSYTWLNLVAELGGYVGLFLGYSVYQLTDLIDFFLQKNWIEGLKKAYRNIQKQ